MNTDYDTFRSLGLTDTKPASTGNSNELGQADFLRLMVTQLTKQDPMKPQDPTQFFNQLSQFSTVSSLQQLQQSFSDFSAAMASDQGLQASNLVGRSVLAPADRGLLQTSEGLSGEVTLPKDAPSVSLKVLDDKGQPLRQLDLGAHLSGQVPFVWDGKLEDGSRASPGLYTLKAEARMEGQNQSVETQVLGKVESVTLGKNGNRLEVNLAGVGPVKFTDLRKIF
jgi:flagellar basal-body rod modification protein FlgD